MTTGRDEGEPQHWLEDLHQAIVAGRGQEFNPDISQASELEEFSALRDCLHQLEQARQFGSWDSGDAAQQGTESDAPLEIPRRVGKFEIIRPLGDGGQGIVFLAFDTELRRQVALKVPRPDALTSPEKRRRFLREAHAAAALNHPAIVAVHEIGEAFPACYLVCDYCPGGSLQQYLREHASEIKPREAAQFVAELAAAVQYAHEHGVLHRDIKPSNVFLVPREDRPLRSAAPSLLDYRPRLGDFGLARLAENTEDKTATGVILGTPAYMAPEQAGGRLAEVCAATDVYGLGTILYELLAGKSVFRGVTEADTLRQVLFVEPEPLRTRDLQVPRDLDAVCLRALDKNPQRRYSTAAALADDLHRYLDGLPTLVRPLTPFGKLWRAARRRPAVASLLGLLSLALLAGLAVLVRSDIQQRRLNEQLVEQRNAAERLARESLDLAYTADMQLAEQAFQKNSITELEDILARYVPSPGRHDARDLSWYLLYDRLHHSSQLLTTENGQGGCVRVSPDGSQYFAGSLDGKIRAWDAATLRLQWISEEPRGSEVNSLAFAPGGVSLLAALNDGRIVFLSRASGQLERTLSGGHEDWVADIDFSPDGERLCSVAADGHVVVWDWSNGKVLQKFRAHHDVLRAVRFTRDGQHVVTAAQDGDVQVWRLADEHPVATLQARDQESLKAPYWPRGIALSPDLSRLAVCWDRGGLLVYDITQPDQPRQLQAILSEQPAQCIFLDNEHLATASTYGTGKIWTLGRDEPDHVLIGHRSRIYKLDTTPDRSHILTNSRDGTVRLWSMGLPALGAELANLNNYVVRMEISPDGQELILRYIGAKGAIIWNLPAGESRITFSTSEAPRAADYVANGRWLAIASEKQISFYSRTSPAPEWHWEAPGSNIEEIISNDDLVTFKSAKELWGFDIKQRKLLWHRALDEGLWGIAIAPEGDRIYVTDHLGRLHILDAATGTILKSIQAHADPVNYLLISPDGRQLLTSTNNREMFLWDRQRLQVVRRFVAANGYASDPQFTNDGRAVAAIVNRNNYCVWNVPTGRLLTTIDFGDEVDVRHALAPRENAIYLTVAKDGRTSLRKIAWDDVPSLNAAQIAPMRPD